MSRDQISPQSPSVKVGRKTSLTLPPERSIFHLNNSSHPLCPILPSTSNPTPSPCPSSRASSLTDNNPRQSPQPPGELFNSANFRSTATPSASPTAGPSTPSSTGTLPDADANANAPPTTPASSAAPSALDTFSAAYDPSKLHPLAGLGDNLDFLQLEEDKLTDVHGAQSVLPSRGWTDDLCVGTGTTYLSGEHGDSNESFVPSPSPIDHGLGHDHDLAFVTSNALFSNSHRLGLAVGGMWGFREGLARPLGNNASFKSA